MNELQESRNWEQAIIGCLLGTAVGDAIGLPTEGLTAQRQCKLFPGLDGHRFLRRRGMCSDDTEHTCIVAESLIIGNGDVTAFTKSFAKRLRAWFLCLPAGAGLATIKASLRLWLGFPPERSGVFSAGNGPAMRSAIIGVYCADDLSKLRSLVTASTCITHTDLKAEFGAIAVALAASIAGRAGLVEASDYCRTLEETLGPEADELLQMVARAAESAARGEDTAAFAQSLGLKDRVSGYVYHTVPVVLHAWFRYPQDYRRAVLSVVKCGGDTDTTAAIVGGIVGASVGEEGIPREWLDGILEWPRSVNWMRELGRHLAADGPQVPPRVPLAPLVARNLFFLAVVLAHGFRRMLPPY